MKVPVVIKFLSKRSKVVASRKIYPNAFYFLGGLILWSCFQMVISLDFGRDPVKEGEYHVADGLRDKLKGVHYFAHFRETEVNFDKVSSNHIRQIVLVPYAFQEAHDSPDLEFRRRNRRRSFDRDSLYLALADKAREHHLEIIVKPHIWMRPEAGKWRSDIDFSEGPEFRKWSESYREYILYYARLSEKMGATHFCIGTELSGLTRGHDLFWRQLIQDVRDEFSGKLFYAANWYREYEQIKFWPELDYIGVQAYFPVCKKTNPDLDDLKDGWKDHFNRLRKISRKYNKPVLFSEVGYRSSDDAGINPWTWVESHNVDQMIPSESTQAICYEAFFQTFWHEPWFAGALIWQWHADYENAGALDPHARLDFTPQNKQAQSVIAHWFSNGN